jgi:hypothetical protein
MCAWGIGLVAGILVGCEVDPTGSPPASGIDSAAPERDLTSQTQGYRITSDGLWIPVPACGSPYQLISASGTSTATPFAIFSYGGGFAGFASQLQTAIAQAKAAADAALAALSFGTFQKLFGQQCAAEGCRVFSVLINDNNDTTWYGPPTPTLSGAVTITKYAYLACRPGPGPYKL